MQAKTVLITGGAKRVGAAICRRLHGAGANLMLHYRASAGEARLLQAELNHARPNSVSLIQADLLDLNKLFDTSANNAQCFGPSVAYATHDDYSGGGGPFGLGDEDLG